MRKAYNNSGILTNNDKFIGVSLGYDFCAEHEWGIKGLKRKFGIPESTKHNMGLACRTITNCDNDTIVLVEETFKKKKFAVLYTKGYFSDIPYDLRNYKEDILWNIKRDEERKVKPEDRKHPIITAWDEGSFGIGVMGEDEVAFLKELHQVFLNKNVVIAFTSIPNNPFAGTSLCVLIKDLIPEDVSEQMYLVDKEFYDRENYEKKIGMKKIIEKYGNKNG